MSNGGKCAFNGVRRSDMFPMLCWDAKMALRWTAAGMFEAKTDFRRIKAYKQRPILKKALTDHRRKREPDQIKDAA